MKKHIGKISLALCLALLTTFFSACSETTTAGTSSSGQSAQTNTSASDTSEEQSDKPYAGQNLVLFSFAGWLDESLQETVSSKLEEDTGMTVEYIIVPWSERFSKMTVMVASGEQVDVTGKSTPADMAVLCDAGALLPVNDYINNSEVFSEDNWMGWEYMNMMTYAEDGKWYGVPCKPPQGYIWTINQAWLDELDLEVPKNLDELMEVLRAFKEADLGNGATIPIAHQFPNSDHIATFLGMWGLEGPYLMEDEDGKIYHPWLTKEGLEGLKWMQDIYAEGLLDPEFANEDGTTIYDKVKSGLVGIFLDWPGSNKGYNEAAQESGAKCNFVPMQIPSAKEGVTPVNCGNTIIMNNIVTTTANPDAAWAFIEWLNTSDGIMDWTWTEGVNYQKDENGEIEILVTQSHASGYSTQDCLVKDFYENEHIFPATDETLEGYDIFFQSWAFPSVLPGAGDADEIALPLATQVICNQMTIEDFEQRLRSELLAQNLITE